MADSSPRQVLDNVAKTMRECRDGSKPLFEHVSIHESLDAFRRVADPMAGLCGGVIAGCVRQGLPTFLGEAYPQRIDMTLALKLTVPVINGEDDSKAMTELYKVIAIVREAMSVDVTRGGLCSIATVDKRMTMPTDLRGEPKIVAPKKGHAFYVATWPLACGRSVPAPAVSG